jgi:hypothetical protein
VISFTAHSQTDSFDETYTNATVYFKGNKLLYQGEKYRFKEFSMEFSKYQQSAEEFDNYLSNRRVGLLLFGLGYASALGSSFIPSSNPVIEGTLFTAGLATCIVSVSFSIKSQNSLHKAVWNYNKDALKSRLH